MVTTIKHRGVHSYTVYHIRKTDNYTLIKTLYLSLKASVVSSVILELNSLYIRWKLYDGIVQLPSQ